MSYYKGCEIKITGPLRSLNVELIKALEAQLPGAEIEWTESDEFKRAKAREAFVPKDHSVNEAVQIDGTGNRTSTGALTLIRSAQAVLDKFQREHKQS